MGEKVYKRKYQYKYFTMHLLKNVYEIPCSFWFIMQSFSYEENVRNYYPSVIETRIKMKYPIINSVGYIPLKRGNKRIDNIQGNQVKSSIQPRKHPCCITIANVLALPNFLKSLSRILSFSLLPESMFHNTVFSVWVQHFAVCWSWWHTSGPFLKKKKKKSMPRIKRRRRKTTNFGSKSRGLALGDEKTQVCWINSGTSSSCTRPTFPPHCIYRYFDIQTSMIFH